MDIHKIVKKLSTKSSNIFDLDDLAEYVDPGFAKGAAGKSATYKLAYRLKSMGMVIPIRNGLYLFTGKPLGNDGKDAVRAVEDAYWKIVKKLVTKNCGGNYVVG